MCIWSEEEFMFLCFFFSSRRRHTRFDCDWSSDVCSSDLVHRSREGVAARIRLAVLEGGYGLLIGLVTALGMAAVLLIGVGHVRAGTLTLRSEERRVGKEGRSRWSPYH